MADSKTLTPVRFVDGKPMVIAGLVERRMVSKPQELVEQWQRFGKRIGNIPDAVGRIAYGLAINMRHGGDGWQSVTGVEVSNLSQLPEDLGAVRLPAQRYAVFKHDGNVSTIRETIGAALNQWLPRSGFSSSEFPDLLERYGDDFNPATGDGDIEVWIPLKR